MALQLRPGLLEPDLGRFVVESTGRDIYDAKYDDASGSKLALSTGVRNHPGARSRGSMHGVRQSQRGYAGWSGRPSRDA